PAVQQIDQQLQRVLDDGVRPLTLDVYEEPHAARVVLELWVVQALGRDRSLEMHRCFIAHFRPDSERNFLIGAMRTASGPATRPKARNSGRFRRPRGAGPASASAPPGRACVSSRPRPAAVGRPSDAPIQFRAGATVPQSGPLTAARPSPPAPSPDTE